MICSRSLKEKKDKEDKSDKTTAGDDQDTKSTDKSKKGIGEDHKEVKKDAKDKKDKTGKKDKTHFNITVPNRGGEISQYGHPLFPLDFGKVSPLSSGERKLADELNEMDRKDDERRFEREKLMSDAEKLKFDEDYKKSLDRRSEILNKLYPPIKPTINKLTSSERKKLEDDFDETHKKISEVFQKLRKKSGSKEAKHNENDVSELRKHKMKEQQLINKLFPQYDVYGPPTGN